MPRILKTRQLGNLEAPRADKPLPLRSDLPSPGVRSDGGAVGNISQGSANGGIPFSGETDTDFQGDWGDF
jgi:hypothetical protein